MQHDHPTIRPPAQGGIAYVEPAKRLQQWLQGRGRDEHNGVRATDIPEMRR